jgi:hypothetical protein
MSTADTTAVSVPADIRQPIVVHSKGQLVGRLIGIGISSFDASDLADLDEGDQYTVDLGNHACGGRALDGPHHDLWIIGVTGGWWLLLPAPGGEGRCGDMGCDGLYAPRPLSADKAPAELTRKVGPMHDALTPDDTGLHP